MKQTSEPIDPAHFDVREIPCRVKHAQIFQRWTDLPVGGHFVLVNDHDPVPLWYQFCAQFPDAFGWEYLLRGPEEFRVKITKHRAVTVEPRAIPTTPPCPDAAVGTEKEIEEIDARGLEPPEPLIRILAGLEALAVGKRLRAMTDRRPCHLFGEAEQRGFRHDSNEQPDGTWITLLERA
jgi:uncharacterized protein (DUF2249 family)